ncbi:MAG: PD-(D/E)XK nuclease domain-containing protein, partial [Dysgonamonadaceae bacterium]|nr:PD-(D/E)XK nuclease domain-containing protein [Dysgonamonadaceae bacterium]
LKAINFDIPKLENGVKIQATAIMDYRIDNRNPVPVLYQSGYLTVKDYDRLMDKYTLGFPNEEVRYGFYNELLREYMPGKDIWSEFYVANFIEDLLSHDTESFMTRLKAFFADVPYELNNKAEKHFQTVFYIFFKLMGQYVEVEYRTATGRIDAVVTAADTVYVFEFKLSDSATAEDAIRQIDEKGYLIPFTASGKRLVKIGVAFSLEERGVSQWIVK